MPLLGEELHHAARVVRVRVDEIVEVFDGRGAAASARVRTSEKDSVIVDVIESLPTREVPREVIVAAALINLDRFELALQKCTELGATRFLPLLSDEVEIRVERVLGKISRWQKIIQEAAKQSGRAVIPECSEPVEFDDIFTVDATRLLLDADTAETPWDPASETRPIMLMIGPEGGWSQRELTLARDRGAVVRHLGPRRLRAETAAITATAMIVGEIEGW